MCEKSQSQGHGRASLAENFEKVKKRIGLEYFSKSDTGIAWELCLIMAEVMTLPKGFTVSIAGEKYPAKMVCEVYDLLETEHIRFVIEKFREIDYTVRHRKSYLRTALYHAAFEMESYYEQLY